MFWHGPCRERGCFLLPRPTENSREGNGVAAGHFTWSLLNALHRAKGTLSSNGVDFISDIDAFNLASSILHKRWPNDATPEWNGLRGDFPMLISQAETPVGAGLVYVDMPKTGLRADVTVDVYERRGLPTEIRCHLVDTNDQYLGSATLRVEPTRDEARFNHQFSFKSNALPVGYRRALDSGNRVALKWHVELVEPFHNMLLDQTQAKFTYWR